MQCVFWSACERLHRRPFCTTRSRLPRRATSRQAAVPVKFTLACILSILTVPHACELTLACCELTLACCELHTCMHSFHTHFHSTCFPCTLFHTSCSCHMC